MPSAAPFAIKNASEHTAKSSNATGTASGVSGVSRHFECTEAGAAKFWAVSSDDVNMTTRWGEIGTTGQEKTKSFASADKAATEIEKLILEKTSKGYIEIIL